MKIIVGLGNPGPRYRNSRHNLGFAVLDTLAETLGTLFSKEKHKGLLAQATYKGQKLLLVKPQTYMNRSGDCIAAVARNKIHDPADLLVAVDDINLPLGRLRLREGGSAGGHNGLKSTIERIGSDAFHRLRIGIGDERQSADLSDHVLRKFLPEERPLVAEMVTKSVEAAQCWIAHGIERAMNEFN